MTAAVAFCPPCGRPCLVCACPALPAPRGLDVDEPLWRIPVRSDIRGRAITDALLYAMAALIAWTWLPRTGLQHVCDVGLRSACWIHDGLLAGSLVVAFFAIRSLVVAHNSDLWVRNENAKRRHERRLRQLRRTGKTRPIASLKSRVTS